MQERGPTAVRSTTDLPIRCVCVNASDESFQPDSRLPCSPRGIPVLFFRVFPCLKKLALMLPIASTARDVESQNPLTLSCMLP
uniref:Uncharacterized protein n=1 Tax=Anguilla anguilla TaxID=7936 RepID=A0A0E9SWQ4_ANGAN